MELTANEKLEALEKFFIANQSVLLARSAMAAALGKTFGGERDLYTVLGYKTELAFDDYFAKYDRGDMAGTIIEKPVTETWRKPPLIKDGPDATGRVDTPFVVTFQALAKRLKLWHYLTRVDILAGIGQYGVLLLGLRDGKLDVPAKKGQCKKPEDLLFLAVFDEQSAPVNTLVQAANDVRFGHPEFYTLDMGRALTNLTVTLGQKRTHWSRVIHLAENLLENDVLGRPRLKGVLNRLEDLEKVVGGGAEAVWKLIYKGIIANAKEGYSLPTDLEAWRDELQEYIHGLRRELVSEGIEYTIPGGEVVDPTGMFMILVRLISARTNIPWQMLIGAERGDVANKQDQATWAGYITSRQTNYAEPILRELIDRLIWLGCLPAPTSGGYAIVWPPLFEMTEVEEGALAQTRASAMKTAAEAAAFVEVTPEEIRGFGGLPPQPVGTTETVMLDGEDYLSGVA